MPFDVPKNRPEAAVEPVDDWADTEEAKPAPKPPETHKKPISKPATKIDDLDDPDFSLNLDGDWEDHQTLRCSNGHPQPNLEELEKEKPTSSQCPKCRDTFDIPWKDRPEEVHGSASEIASKKRRRKASKLTLLRF
jgi:hypothetical protein